MVTNKYPFIVVNVLTSNPLFGEIEAVADPLDILNASFAKAANGILNNPAPLPVNTDADTAWNVEKVFTTNPWDGEIDAVALPLNIFVESIDKFDKSILEIYLPSPIKYEPDVIIKLPLISTEPVNSEPLAED